MAEHGAGVALSPAGAAKSYSASVQAAEVRWLLLQWPFVILSFEQGLTNPAVIKPLPFIPPINIITP